MRYTVLITDSTGATIADLSDRCLSRRYQTERNRPDYISLKFDIADLDAYLASINQTVEDVFAVNQNEIHIYRDDTEMTAGQIDYLRVNITDGAEQLEVIAHGWLQLFARALTPISETYSSTDLGEIMWDLIDTFQTQTDADYGITEGSIETSRDGDRTYSYKNIKDAIIQLSEVSGGPDFEITPDKVFNVYYPTIGNDNSGIVFSYPGNILTVAYARDGARMANQVIAEGAGTGTERLLSIANDTARRSAYKMRQKRIQYPDVELQDTLDGHAVEDLRVLTNFVDLPVVVVDGDVDPTIGDYSVGDVVIVQATRYQSLLAPILGQQRIERIKVDIDENDVERVTLSLDKP